MHWILIKFNILRLFRINIFSFAPVLNSFPTNNNQKKKTYCCKLHPEKFCFRLRVRFSLLLKYYPLQNCCQLFDTYIASILCPTIRNKKKCGCQFGISFSCAIFTSYCNWMPFVVFDFSFWLVWSFCNFLHTISLAESLCMFIWMCFVRVCVYLYWKDRTNILKRLAFELKSKMQVAL